MKLARVRHRMIAAILDYLIILGIAFILFITVWPGVIVSIITNEPVTLMMVLKLLRTIILYTFVVLGYYAIVPLFLKGQTIGKKVFKLKIVTIDESEIDYKVMFFREAVCRILIRNLSLGLSDIISCIIMIIREDNKTLADVFAKTKVIDLKEEI